MAVFTGVGFGPLIGEYVLADTRFEEAFLVGAGFALLAALIAVFAPPAFGFSLPDGISYVKFGLTVALALGAQVATSTVIGAMLPIGARSIKLDPAVIAAPAITTAVDVSGMVIYFTVAHSILNL